MQIIGSETAEVGGATRIETLRAMAAGTILLAAATSLAYAVFGAGLLDVLMPRGLTGGSQVGLGILAWTFALTGPAAFGVAGMARVAFVLDRALKRRVPPTPAAGARHALADDHAVAVRVRIPDGSRAIPEIVIGPFGAAVIDELPPAWAVLSRGARTWEVRMAGGRTQTIDQPLDRASRDADRVRRWLGDDDADHVVKVYAAVVGNDAAVPRTSSCASITTEQVAAWLTSLPVQRSFDEARRERAIRMIRAVV